MNTATWNRARPWLGAVVRLVLGIVWIYAALEKTGNPRTFVQAVRAYDATPEWLSQAIGYGLPVLELCIGVLLVLGLAVRLAAATSVALFVVFLIGLVQAAARGIQLECGCFGGGGATTGGTTYTLDILRDIGLLVLAAFVAVWPLTRLSMDEFLARNDDVEAPSAKRMRTEQGRRKYNAMLEARQQAARSRTRWLNASLAAVVLLIALIGLGVQSNRAKIQGSLVATNATVANGVVYGKKAAATVDVFEDFQCPNCLHFEESAQSTVDAAVKANKAQVRFHLMSFLDSSSNGNRYSSRAANAALCASDVSVNDFVAFHNLLFTAAVQPAEGSHGRPDSDFDTYAKKIGLSGVNLTDFQGCVSTEKHKALVEALEEQASKDGITGTPTIKVNGKTITASVAAFTSAVNAALKNGPAPSPSPTPSPSRVATPSAPVTPSTKRSVTPSSAKVSG